jgi:hypothetical protein
MTAMPTPSMRCSPPRGNTVSLLIQREMTIDYDPLGRRLHHASALDPHRRDALD